MSKLVIESHVGEVLSELNHRIPVILEALGIEAEGNAVTEITELGAVDTGRLRNSITFATREYQGVPNTRGGEPATKDDYSLYATPEDTAVYIGTNVEYGQYIELGTSKMAARPFLRNAVANYTDDYKRIIEEGLK